MRWDHQLTESAYTPKEYGPSLAFFFWLCFFWLKGDLTVDVWGKINRPIDIWQTANITVHTIYTSIDLIKWICKCDYVHFFLKIFGHTLNVFVHMLSPIDKSKHVSPPGPWSALLLACLEQTQWSLSFRHHRLQPDHWSLNLGERKAFFFSLIKKEPGALTNLPWSKHYTNLP